MRAVVLYDGAGDVHMQIFERGANGIFTIKWERDIGTVKVPPGLQFCTAPFGVAIEDPIRQLVGKVTGQTFAEHTATSKGPDLLPVTK